MKSKYIEITDGGVSKTGKTRVWIVTNVRNQSKVGEIRWYGGWRKYAFYPTIEGVRWIAFDSECMGQIAEKLDEVNARRKEGRRRAKIEFGL